MKIEIEKDDQLVGFPLWRVMVDGEPVVALRTENEAAAMVARLSAVPPGRVVDDAGDDVEVDSVDIDEA